MEGNPHSRTATTTGISEPNMGGLLHQVFFRTMELELVLEAAKGLVNLSSTKLQDLQQLLQALEKERDQALHEIKELQERCVHDVPPQHVVSMSSSMEACVNHAHTLLIHGGQPSMHTLSQPIMSKPQHLGSPHSLSVTHELQSNLCLDEENRSTENGGSPDLYDNNWLKKADDNFRNLSSFDGPHELFSMDILNDNIDFSGLESLNLVELQLDGNQYSPWEANTRTKSSGNPGLSRLVSHTCTAFSSQVQSQKPVIASPDITSTPAQEVSALQTPCDSPIAIGETMTAMSASQSVSASPIPSTLPTFPYSLAPVNNPLAMLASYSKSAVLNKDCISVSKLVSAIPMATRIMSASKSMSPTPFIKTRSSSEHELASQSGVAKTASEVCMHSSAMLQPPCTMASHSSSPSWGTNLPPTTAVVQAPTSKLLVKPVSASSSADQATTMLSMQTTETTSAVPQKRKHLPEPAAANMDVLLRLLPKKGKLLEAVVKAGPLLKDLMAVPQLPEWRNAAPLPWKNAPSMKDNMPIQAPTSPTTVLVPFHRLHHITPPHTSSSWNPPTSNRFQ